MASETERVDYRALIRAEHLRKEAGRQALRALVYDLGPNSTVEDAVYGLAQEVLALRERVAALEASSAELARRCDHLFARQVADFTILQGLVDGLARKTHDAETRLAALEDALAARGDAGEGE